MRSIRGVIGRVGPAMLAAAIATITAPPAPAGAGTADPSTPFVGAAVTPTGTGLLRLDASGGVHTAGDAGFFGSIPQRRLAGQAIADVTAVAIETTPTGNGYWVFDGAGGVHTFGDARYFGSIPALRNAGVSIGRSEIVAAAVTSSGDGYWMLDGAGGVHTFGDARYFGSIPALRNAGRQIGPADAVDIAPTGAGGGYLVLDAAGGIFTFGDARFFGSLPGLRNAGQAIGPADVRDLVVATDNRGYWVTDSAGGIFTFGDVGYHGSAPGRGVTFDLAATAVVPGGAGYWMVDRNGSTLAFGSAGEPGGAPAARLPRGGPHAFIARHPDGSPVRPNRCRAHGYVIRYGTAAPENARHLVTTAFDALSRATGITFRYDGTTSERYEPDFRTWYGDPRYGDRISPILVSFEAPDDRNRLGDDGGSAWAQFARNDVGRTVIVSGSVAVNTTAGLTRDFAHGASYGAVLLHELGHVVGLDHVDDRVQIMSSVLSPADPGTYQSGDLEGLSALGRGAGCVADPTPG